MNKRDSQSDKLLLDTSFLLPIMGFETSKDVMDSFKKLGRYSLYYNDISILEALWKIVKTIDGSEEKLVRIMEGIRAIRNTMNNVAIDEEAVRMAIAIYNLGHRDIIDNLLYSLARRNRLKLLTVDKELIRFIDKQGLPREAIVTPDEL